MAKEIEDAVRADMSESQDAIVNPEKKKPTTKDGK